MSNYVVAYGKDVSWILVFIFSFILFVMGKEEPHTYVSICGFNSSYMFVYYIVVYSNRIYVGI